MRRSYLSLVFPGILFGISVSPAVSASEFEKSDSAEVHFRQGRAVIDRNFAGNSQSLDSLISELENKSNSDFPKYTLQGIRVSGAASPEGSMQINNSLSERRAAAIFDYLGNITANEDSISSFRYIGRDWSGLLEAVRQDDNVPEREKVIEIIGRYIGESAATDPRVSDELLDELHALSGGIPYNYLYYNIFPGLRESKIYFDYNVGYDLGILTPYVENIEYVIPVSDQCDTQFLHRTTAPERNFYMGLKTNMLYDVLAVPNIGAEFYIGKNWSVAGNWMYGWWSRNSSHHYWRVYGGDVAFRKWFGSASRRKPLTGHHLGLYAGVVTYDFEWGGKGYMGGIPGGTLWDRCQYIAGIEYGYSLPVGRRINIDFTIGLGYRGGKYLEYIPKDNFYLWESTHRVNWIGPTKAEISLVWLIGHGNYNSGKGGKK